ncbi:Cyclopentanone 1,2-monooxygenase (CPMO) [Thoreauomyces humboldtii]|nr:Cyclopentanone 1,2-monooxygenase (CPMO) [Thoreauomyces humboldtii]
MRFQHGDLGKFGLKPGHHIFEAHPTINGQVLDRIASGRVLVRPNVTRFHEDGTTVEFDDGTTEGIDEIVYCTGYRIEHPFLDDALAVLGQERADSNRIRLYKNVFPLRHRNIAFIGLAQPIGALMPVAEMQARWVARVVAGKTDLPSPSDMRDEVDLDWTRHQHNFLPKERHTIEVEYVTYMDELASKIGCKPDVWQMIRQGELGLASKVLFGPAIPAQFRLQGPGKWEGAAHAINDACSAYDFSNREVEGGAV